MITQGVPKGIDAKQRNGKQLSNSRQSLEKINCGFVVLDQQINLGRRLQTKLVGWDAGHPDFPSRPRDRTTAL